MWLCLPKKRREIQPLPSEDQLNAVVTLFFLIETLQNETFWHVLTISTISTIFLWFAYIIYIYRYRNYMYIRIYIWIIPTSITRVDSLSKGSQLHPAWEIRTWNVDLKHWSSEIWVPFSVEIPKNHLGNWSKKDGKSWKTNNFPGEFNWITMKVMEYEL